MLRYVIAAAGLAVSLAAVPADASHARVGYFTGNGTIFPGLSTTCTAQDRTFNGAFAIEPSVLRNHGMAVNGGSPCATTAFENGNLVVNGDVQGNLGYSRSGSVVTLTGRLDVDGHGHDVRCVVAEIPNSIAPTTTYHWYGVCAFGV